MGDPVNHPDHYNAHPVCEAIDICEHLPYSLGNVVKYLWRSGQKGDGLEDLRKALWYMRRHGAFLRAVRGVEEARYPREVVALSSVLAKHATTPDPLRVFLETLLDPLDSLHQTLELAYHAIRAQHAELEAEPDFDEGVS